MLRFSMSKLIALGNQLSVWKILRKLPQSSRRQNPMLGIAAK